MPSDKAPDISGIILNGTQSRYIDSANKPVFLYRDVLMSREGKRSGAIIHFWATWCKICEFEHNSINSIAEDYAVLTIASQSGSIKNVSDYISKQKITAPVITDESGKLSRLYGVKAFPTTFVLSPDGSISNIEVGYTSEWGLRFRLWLSKVLI